MDHAMRPSPQRVQSIRSVVLFFFYLLKIKNKGEGTSLYRREPTADAFESDGQLRVDEFLDALRELLI